MEAVNRTATLAPADLVHRGLVDAAGDDIFLRAADGSILLVSMRDEAV